MAHENLQSATETYVQPIKRLVPFKRETFRLAEGGRQYDPGEYRPEDRTRIVHANATVVRGLRSLFDVTL